VAATHNYWSNLHALKGWISALLGTVLWPLILIGRQPARPLASFARYSCISAWVQSP
jgi:hypothetical protein